MPSNDRSAAGKKPGWRRILKLTLGIGALLLAAIAATLRVLFPPEKVKALALAQLERSLQREVRLESASIGLRGASLTGLEVSESPDFSAGTALSARSLDVSLRIWPLLTRRKIEIVKLSLDGWTARVVASSAPAVAAGAPPAAAAGAKTPASGEPDASSEGVSLEISALSLSNGAVEYLDQAQKLSVALKSVKGSAAGVSLDRPFDARLAFSYAIKSGPESYAGTADLDGRVDYAGGDRARLQIEAKPLALTLGGLKTEFTGRMRNADAPDAELDVTLSPLTAESLKGLVSLPKGVALPATKGVLSAVYANKLLDLRKLDLKGKEFELSLSATQSAEAWKLAPSRLLWGPIELKASGTVQTASKKRKEPALDLSLQTNRFSLADLPASAKAAAKGLEGKIQLDLQIRGAVSAPEYSGKADFDGVNWESSGQKLSGLTGKVDFSPKLIAGDLRGKWNAGDLDLKVALKDYAGKSPDYRLDGKLSLLDLSSLPDEREAGKAKGEATEDEKSPAKESPDSKPLATSGSIVIGKINHENFKAAESRLDWNLKELTSDLKSLDGTIKFRVGPGRFDNIKLLAAKKPLAKLVLLPIVVLQRTSGLVKVPLFPKFDAVEFKEITGDYVVTNGVVKIVDSHLDSPAAYTQMSGEADIARDQLDLRVATKVAASLGLNVAGPIGFKVRGSLSSPQVSLDPISIFKQPAVDKGLKQGADLIRGLFK